MTSWIVIIRASQGRRISTEHVGPFDQGEALDYARARQEEPDTVAEIRVLTRPS